MKTWKQLETAARKVGMSLWQSSCTITISKDTEECATVDVSMSSSIKARDRLLRAMTEAALAELGRRR